MSPSGIYWNPNIFVSEEPMQYFVTLASFFLIEMKGLQKKEELEKMTFIVATQPWAAHTLPSDQNRDDYKQ